MYVQINLKAVALVGVFNHLKKKKAAVEIKVGTTARFLILCCSFGCFVYLHIKN